MARARKPQTTPLTQVRPGDTFAIPLANGRLGACRVVRKGRNPTRVAALAVAWTGDAPPTDLGDPLLRTPLVLTHHSWAGQTYCHWVSEAVPAGFVALGNLKVTPEEAALDGGASAWNGFQYQCLMQWRWDNE